MLPRMGLPVDGYELDVPEHGERSMVIFLRVAEREFVIRCYPARSARVRTARALRKGRAYGVNVPRILYTDNSRATRRALGGAIVVEERIPGCHTGEYPDRDRMLRIVAEGVSRMHNVTRPRWGNLTFGHRRGYYQRQIQAIRKHLRKAANKGLTAASEQEGRILEWLGGFNSEVERFHRFSFSHRAVGPDNVLISPQDEFYLIDVQRLCFEHYAAGLVRCITEFCQTGEEEAFLDTYFGVAEGRNPAEFRRVQGFFHVIYLSRIAVGAIGGHRHRDGTPMAEVLTKEILESLD